MIATDFKIPSMDLGREGGWKKVTHTAAVLIRSTESKNQMQNRIHTWKFNLIM